jgi:hypothetical protein
VVRVCGGYGSGAFRHRLKCGLGGNQALIALALELQAARGQSSIPPQDVTGEQFRTGMGRLVGGEPWALGWINCRRFFPRWPSDRPWMSSVPVETCDLLAKTDTQSLKERFGALISKLPVARELCAGRQASRFLR